MTSSTGTPLAIITGPCGQDGSLLAHHLANRGYRVVGIVRPGFSAASRSAPPNVELVEADICDEGVWSRLVSTYSPREIYHLAACHHSTAGVGLTSDHRLKGQMVETNFLSTKALAFAVLEARSDCRVIYAGSSQMYSPEQLTHPINETSETKPRTFYGHTKAWSMDLLGQLRKDSGLWASTAILFNHESPLRGPEFVSRKISQAAAAVGRGAPVSLELLNIGARADWSGASDVVRALHLMAEADAPADFVIASGKVHSVRAMLDVAFGQVGVDWRPFVTTRRDEEEPTLVGHPAQIQSLLGWRPLQSFEETVRQMVEADMVTVDPAPQHR